MYDFSENAIMPLVRTKFSNIYDHKTTFNSGKLIPIYHKEILPGDSLKIELNTLIKMTTPKFQTMDQAYVDIHWYFVPRRLVWKHWKEFQGEKQVPMHEESPEYSIPQTTAPQGGWGENTIADYLTIPTKISNIKVDSAYFRAICLIWNNYYRDEQRMDTTDFYNGDSNETGSNGSNYVTDAIKGGACLPVCKLHDYFTSGLNQPQAGPPVELPLGTTAETEINADGTMILRRADQDDPHGFKMMAMGSDYNGNSANAGGPGGYQTMGYYIPSWNPAGSSVPVYSELKYDSGLKGLTNLATATAATVNQLRMAFQLQKIFEANNRSGTRYVEILKNRWQVKPSNGELQIPEWLGGQRFPLNIDMVVQTSETTQTSPLGNIAGFSNTRYDAEYFSSNFDEHGIVLGFAMVRHQRTYQQGLSRFFTRKNMTDFFMPEFQNLGERPTYNYEIYAQGTDDDNDVFNYQEYGAEYRYEPNKVTGQFRSNATNSFDFWHYADDYSELPVSNEDWIKESPTAIDRTLTVTSETANQFYADFSFKETMVRSMPPHSIPGFIDHH